MKSIRTNPRNDAAEGDERIRTAAPSTPYTYEDASIRTTFDLYGHLDTQDVLADLAVIEGRA